MNDDMFNKNYQSLNETLTKGNIESINFLTSYSLSDYLFPIHLLIPVKEKIFENLNQSYISNNRYYSMKRFKLLCLLNTNNSKFFSGAELKTIKKIEDRYFAINSLIVLLGISTLFIPIKNFPFLNIMKYYIGFDLIFNRRTYSIALIKTDLNKMCKLYEDKIIKQQNIYNENEIGYSAINTNDILDETMIEDWKCYLYWNKLY